jgi:hypothetical protein
MTCLYNIINKVKQSNMFHMTNIWKNWKYIILSTRHSFHICKIISILKIHVDTAEGFLSNVLSTDT